MSTAMERDEHGRTGYRLGCRCRACKLDMRRAAREQWALRQLARGRQPAFRVPVSSVVAHLDRLIAAGMTLREIARRADVAPSTLTRARLHGSRLSNITAHAVLAVEP